MNHESKAITRTRHLAKENDEFSDQHVWSTIRYLDPERNCQNAGRPVLVPVIVFLTFWIIFLAAMYSLTVRVSDTGIFRIADNTTKASLSEAGLCIPLRYHSE